MILFLREPHLHEFAVEHHESNFIGAIWLGATARILSKDSGRMNRAFLRGSVWISAFPAISGIGNGLYQKSKYAFDGYFIIGATRKFLEY